ncbi:MAG: hypothetical protein H7Z11_21465 [Verrucomicrobia bacterium]|nr:hypothetical protein [Leptolyngbya sp. ES-bin-22]
MTRFESSPRSAIVVISIWLNRYKLLIDDRLTTDTNLKHGGYRSNRWVGVRHCLAPTRCVAFSIQIGMTFIPI